MQAEELIKLGVLQTLKLIKEKQVTCEEVCKAYLENIEKHKNKNAVLEVFNDSLDLARKIDTKLNNNEKVGKLAGIPIIIKDNMLYKGKKATCASRFLENFVSPYTATAVKKLLDEDAIIIGRANMDEFAMGGSNENSAYGPCKNAFNDEYVAGGSSGGSACSVACNMCCASLGTDTGGSVRQPSSFNGVVGMKPTYGRISRYGIVAFASSLDQVGPITKNVEDNAYLLEILAGHDKNDQTSALEKVDDYSSKLNSQIKNLKIATIKELMDKYKNYNEYNNFAQLISFLKENGAEVEEVSIKNIDLVLPSYYIIATAEATSNLGRFDGVKYTTAVKDASNIDDLYVRSRTQGFGKEVQRRIMLGNFVLSSGYYDAYYNKAKKIQQKLKNNFNEIFNYYDAILMPTTFKEAFKLGDKNTDPVSMYLEDLFTVIANVTSIPSINVPYSYGENNLPLGVQFLTKEFNETIIYSLADFVEKNYKRGKNE